MFRGAAKVTLDAKGRMVLPTRYREHAVARSEGRLVVTVEEHTVIGGLGSAVTDALVERMDGRVPRLRRIGIPDVFPDQYGSQDSLLARYNITAKSIFDTIQQLTNSSTNKFHREQSWAD